MIVVENRYIPFGTFGAVNFFGLVFAKHPLDAVERNHEAIHTRQQIEWIALCTVLLLVLIPAWGGSWWWLLTLPASYHVFLYGSMWVVELLLPPYSRAYRDIPLERECYDHQHNPTYLSVRRPFAWVKYVFKRNLNGDKK